MARVSAEMKTHIRVFADVANSRCHRHCRQKGRDFVHANDEQVQDACETVCQSDKGRRFHPEWCIAMLRHGPSMLSLLFVNQEMLAFIEDG